jgi:hypothetical protein
MAFYCCFLVMSRPGYALNRSDFGAPFGKNGLRAPMIISGASFATGSVMRSREQSAGSNPMAENVFHNGLSFGVAFFGKQICVPTYRTPLGAETGLTETPASYSASCNWAENIAGSTSGDESTDTVFTLPRKACIASYCSVVRTRGAIRVSRVMIFDCCTWLIPSSNSNRITVAPASMTTPKNTKAVGSVHKWPPRAASQIMPIPTASPPITAARINTRWGVDGSAVPEKKWPIYVEIGATLILVLFGVVFAVVAMGRYAILAIRQHTAKRKLL